MPNFKLNTILIGFLVLTTCLHVCSKPLQPSPDNSSGLNKASDVLEKRGIFSDISAKLKSYKAEKAKAAARAKLYKAQRNEAAARDKLEQANAFAREAEDRYNYMKNEQSSCKNTKVYIQGCHFRSALDINVDNTEKELDVARDVVSTASEELKSSQERCSYFRKILMLE